MAKFDLNILSNKTKCLKFIKNLFKNNFTKHQWKLLLSLSIINFISGLGDSIQAPNYNPTLTFISFNNDNNSSEHNDTHDPTTSTEINIVPPMHGQEDKHTVSVKPLIIPLDIDPGIIVPFHLLKSTGEDNNNLDNEDQEIKGNSSDTNTTQNFGLAIGGFDITQLIVSPVIGATMHFLGPKNSFLAGIITGASSTTIFGLIQKMAASTLRTFLSFVTSFAVAVGSSGMVIAIYTLLTTEFPRTVALAFAIIQTLNGFGRAIGPAVGSVLIQIAGFTIPFIALGLLHYVLAYFTYSILPNTDEVDEKANKDDDEKPKTDTKISSKLSESNSDTILSKNNVKKETSSGNNEPDTTIHSKPQETSLPEHETIHTSKSDPEDITHEPHSDDSEEPKRKSLSTQSSLVESIKDGVMTRIFSGISNFILPSSTTKPGYTKLESTTFTKSPTTHGNEIEKIEDDESESKSGIRGYISLIKIPGILMYSFAVIVGALISGFITSILQPHLLQFNQESFSIGKIFLIFGSVTSIFSIIWGLLAGKVKKPEYILLFGAAIIFLSILPIGIIPYYLSIQPGIRLAVTTLIILGLGMSAINVSVFILYLDEAKNNGFPENGTTSGLISSIFVTSLALGGFLGPTIATYIYKHIGFRNASIFVFILGIILTILLVIFICMKKPTPHEIINVYDDDVEKEDDEETPLLSDKKYIHTAKYYHHITK